MQLSMEDVEHFFRLHKPLMFFVNQKARSLIRRAVTIEAYSRWTPTDRFQVHQALLGQRGLIDDFIAENPFGFDGSDLEIVGSWRQMIFGKFIAYRPAKPHMVFLTTEAPPMAYGVVALFSPFEELLGPHLPRMVETTLLPFKGRIVYDGLMNGFQITFGAGIKRRFKAEYDEAKARFGIIASLPFSDAGPPLIGREAGPLKGPKKAKTSSVSPPREDRGPDRRLLPCLSR